MRGNQRYRGAYFGDCESRRPLGAKDVEADGAVAVDIGMVDPGREGEFGRLKGIVCREVNVEEKDSSFER